MGKVLCIYHANCADGLGAAWAVQKTLGPEVEFVAAKYGEQHELLTPAECVASDNCPTQEDVPRSCVICDGGLGYCKKCHRGEIELDGPCLPVEMTKDRDILIVDFSYPLPVLRAMAKEARSVLVIDHHKTAQEDLAELPEPDRNWQKDTLPFNLAAIFDQERSGAGLTWDYMHPGTPRPRIIDLIEDRDLWKFAYGDESRAFHAVLASYDWSDLPRMFARIDDWVEFWGVNFKVSLIKEGSAILRAQQQAVRTAVESSRRTIRIAGHVIPVANVPPSMASDAGHLLWQETADGSPILMPFSATYYDGADGKRHFSLRSPEGGADVGQIAKNIAASFNTRMQDGSGEPAIHILYHGTVWAGGGHVHAAGFDAPLGWEEQ